MPTNTEMLVQAIDKKKRVSCFYDGYYREMCPHVIGWKTGVHHVLSFQYAGESSTGLPSEGEWKCMDVDGISQLQFIDGFWFTGPHKTGKPQTCVDQVEATV